MRATGATFITLITALLLFAANETSVAQKDPKAKAAPSLFGNRKAKEREAALQEFGGNEKSEEAVALGLRWLANQQQADGRWKLDGTNNEGSNDVAATAFALLPYLAAGYTHQANKENPHAKMIDKGLKFLLRTQSPKNGHFGGTMYNHALGTITLLEAYALTKDPLLRKSAQAALNSIVISQSDSGGWSYAPDKTSPHRDMCISGWQIMALKTGQAAGYTIPEPVFKKARNFVENCSTKDEGYSYLPDKEASLRMTAVGLLARQHLDKWDSTNQRLQDGLTKYIKANPPGKAQDCYYHYYATQMMFQLGGDDWTEWNEKMRDYLIAKQERTPNTGRLGSWEAKGDKFGEMGGRMMVTSLNVLTLQVYYRYIPIVERPAKKDEEKKEPSCVVAPPELIWLQEKSKDAQKLPAFFANRTGENRVTALRDFGGTEKSEEAVANGLKWLIRQQLADGRWTLGNANDARPTAATAFGLLPFLAAGKTHKPAKDNPYDKAIDKGLNYLKKNQDQKTGIFGGKMYDHGLATIAMCEAYGLSQDPALRASAQKAIDLIVRTQGDTGSWDYEPAKSSRSDMSVSGWQMTALKSGQAAGLNVPKTTIDRAKSYLTDTCNKTDDGYGYDFKGVSTPRMTAVALLCRQHLDDWGPAHPQMSKAIKNFIKPNPPDRQDCYYYYYATQVMFQNGGDGWKEWNGKMRDYLIKKQETAQDTNKGSWSPAGDPWGSQFGRLMVTSLNLLTLQVYYRYTPVVDRPAKKEEEKK